MIAHSKTGCGFRWKFGVIRNGEAIELTEWANNLLLDNLIDNVNIPFAQVLANSWLGYASVVDPVRRDSNSTLLSVSGTACVASGNFFVSTDVGRLIKFNDGVGTGTELYITAYISPTSVTVQNGTVTTPVNATIWYVNQTALNSVSGSQYISSNGVYTGTGSSNGVSAINSTSMSVRRTLQFPALNTSRTFTEVGFAQTSVSTLYDRDVINPPITLVNLDIPYVICELILTYTNNNYAVSNFGGAFNTAGTYNVNGALPSTYGTATSFGEGLNQWVNNSGTIVPMNNAGGIFDRFTTNRIYYLTSTFTQSAFSLLNNVTVTGSAASGAPSSSYSSKSFYLDITEILFNNNGSPINLYGIGLGGVTFSGVTLKFTTNFTVPANYIMTVTWRVSWVRVLVN